MEKKICLFALLLLYIHIAQAQNATAPSTIAVDSAKFGGQLPTVTYYENDLKQYKYEMLRIRIKRLYPYIEIAKKLMNEINAQGTKKGAKTYVRENEKELTEKFEDELKNLNITDGQLLVKLINRETGNSCFDLIKKLKGSFNAFTYQTIGARYGYDLKEPYVKSENMEMEQAIKDLKDGGYLPLLSN